MNIIELQSALQNLNINVTARKIAEIWGMDETSFSKKKKAGSAIKYKNILQLEDKLGIKLLKPNEIPKEYTKALEASESGSSIGCTCKNVQIMYFPDVYLSAGYGVEVFNEDYELVVIDERFLTSEKGMKVNPKNCKLVRISGNSMYPEYQHGDRVIIDESDINLTDGQIYAFRYDGQCYVKEINRAGNTIKCISINKEYEPFFIERDVDFKVFGRIIPRVRL